MLQLLVCYSLIKATSGGDCYCAPPGHHSLPARSSLSLCIFMLPLISLPPLTHFSLLSFIPSFFLPHQPRLRVFLKTKAPLSPFIWGLLSIPPRPVLPWFYLLLSPVPLIFILSYSLPNVPKSLLLTFTLIFSVLSHIQMPPPPLSLFSLVCSRLQSEALTWIHTKSN